MVRSRGFDRCGWGLFGLGLLFLSGQMAGCGHVSEASAPDGRAQRKGGAPPVDAPEISFPPIGRRPSARPDAPILAAGASATKEVTGSPVTAPIAVRPIRSTSPGSGKLERAIERVIASAASRAAKKSKGKMNAGQAVVAVMARDIGSGNVLVSRLASRSMMPASNMKVLTAGAALLGLGLDGRFKTQFEAGGEIVGGRLAGPLVVRAGADPMHEREGDGSLNRWLDPLAKDLARAGIRTIKGPLVIDTSGFEAPGPAEQWPAASDHWQGYCALSGGVSANGGVFRTTVIVSGGRAQVTLRPRHHGLKRRGSVSVKGKRNDLRVGANSAGVTVGGSVPSTMDTFVTEFRHPDPIQLFGESILGGLEARGIRFENRGYREGSGGEQGRTLHTMTSPVRSVLEAVLTDSNNPVTDQLFLLIGHELGGGGSRAKSAAAIRRILEKAGVDAGALRQADGSGLSKANRLTASCLVQALGAVASGPSRLRDTFVSSLPVAGASGGLKTRMRGTSAEGVVAAKTGWVSGASSLSGYVLGPDGQPAIAFSILVGYPRIGGLNTSAWKPMQDEICSLLADEVLAGNAGVVR